MEGPHYKPFESPANPYPLIARDLAEYPVVFDPSTGHYQVSSHRAITEVLLTVGLISILVLLYRVCVFLFPILPAEEKGGHHA